MRYEFFNTSVHMKADTNILVLGDIHGNYSAFSKAVEKALKNNAHIISLGDIVDYGPESVKCFDLMNGLHNSGNMSMVIGNHDIKVYKYFNQIMEGEIRVKINDALNATIDSMKKLSETKQKDFMNKYIRKIEQLYNVMNVTHGNNHYVFTHGAIHPSYWFLDSKKFNSESHKKNFYKSLEKYSLYGEIDKENRINEDGYPNRVYNWIHEIPLNYTVFFGHDINSTEYPVVMNRAVSMDCGSSKGGVLFGCWLNNGMRNFEAFDV